MLLSDSAAARCVAASPGVHTGEVELLGDDVGGLAVHATARVMAEAKPREVLTTDVTRALAAGVPCRFEDRGERALKGLSQPVRVFAVEPVRYGEPTAR